MDKPENIITFKDGTMHGIWERYDVDNQLDYKGEWYLGEKINHWEMNLVIGHTITEFFIK